MKRAVFLLFLWAMILAQPGFTQEKLNIVVTSSWTAAYATLAGIDEYEILAPFEMQHPSEYELQIDDIMKLKNADLIICGGYEVMMEKIRTGLQIEPERILQIKTDYNAVHIMASVKSIAKITGTSDLAEKNLEQLLLTLEESREKIKKAGITDIPVLVQFFIQSISEELGLNIAGVYGPRQLEAFDIQELMQLEFDLIMDNAHNPSAKPLVESKDDVRIAYLLNFPGQGNTTSIEDVIRHNVAMMIVAYSSKR